MIKKKIKILIIIVMLLIVCLFWLLWYGQTHTGSRSGQVFDANTGKPIEGAVVKYTWRTTGFLEGAIGGGGAPISYEILTDKEGKYHIPNLRVKRENILELGLRPDDVLIYKDGYAAYFADLTSIESPVRKPRGYPNDNQIYRKKNNIVKLYPWKEGESHAAHFDSIDWPTSHSSGQGGLLLKELEPERKRADEEKLKKVEEGRKRAEKERAENGRSK